MGQKQCNNLNETLKAIQLLLTHIEPKKRPSKNLKAILLLHKAVKTHLQSQSLIPLQNILKTKHLHQKTWQAREITVHIMDNFNKEKIKALLTKDLVKALQTSTSGIKKVLRLINSNIKIHTKSLEVKKVLEEKIK